MKGVPRPILFKLATSERFERAVRGAPGGDRVAYRLASRYVAGATADDALATARRLAAQGINASIDFFGENVTDPAEAEPVVDAYVALAGRLATDAPPGTYLSIDLSHIGIDEPGDDARRRLDRIAAALPATARIQVGAEQIERADRILGAVLAVARGGGPVAATLQANLRRTPEDARKLAEAGVPIRLVKGAYVETPALAHSWGDETDIAFIDLAYELHKRRRDAVPRHPRPGDPRSAAAGARWRRPGNAARRPHGRARTAGSEGCAGPRVRAVRRPLVPLRDAPRRRIPRRRLIGKSPQDLRDQ